jgi:hypothetical protein
LFVMGGGMYNHRPVLFLVQRHRFLANYFSIIAG